MKKRPISITIIAWYLIVVSAFGMIFNIVSLSHPMVKKMMTKNPMPIPLQLLLIYIGLLITFVSGIGMLNKQNWARFLFVIWGATGFLIQLFISPMKLALLPSILIFIIIALFLFRPAANSYFSEK